MTWEEDQAKRKKIREELWDETPGMDEGFGYIFLDEDYSDVDGCYTAEELRVIADLMDEYKKRLKE